MGGPAGVINLQPPEIDDFDFGLAIPPLDDDFLIGDPGDSHNYDVMLEDLDFDFSFDDLGLPSSDLDGLLDDSVHSPPRLENFNLVDQVNDRREYESGLASFELGSGACLEQSDGGRSASGSGVVDLESPGGELNQSFGNLQEPLPNLSGSDRVISGRSGGDAKGLDYPSPESQGSGNCGSNVSEELQTSSRYVNSFRNFRSGSVRAGNVDEKLRFEGSFNNCPDNSKLKRKNDGEVLLDGGNLELRINKIRKSHCNVDKKYDSSHISEQKDDGDEESKKTRLMRNRESAQLSRQRKKQYVEELENKVRGMHSTIQDLNAKISYFMSENVTLRQQMVAGNGNGNGNVAVPTPQMVSPYYGMIPYPWMPSWPPYMMRQHGSQIPLVPIPRLKSQPPAQLESKLSKKVESRKREGLKTKKVAGVSFLGLLFFFMLFGGLLPMVSEKYGGVREAVYGEKSYFGGEYHENHHGRLLTVNGIERCEKYGDGSNHSSNNGFQHCRRTNDSRWELSADQFVHSCNGSEPLTASLYVPRNDKLVKIDGNLIIHSFLASEKALISHGKEGGENQLAVRGVLPPSIHALDARLNDRLPHLRALDSGSADNDKLKSNANDGSLQQWFHEGLSGSLLSSGVCTEVFQFDVLSASSSGAIVPVTASRNISKETSKNSTHLGKARNRRILQGHPIPLRGSSSKISEEKDERNPHSEKLNRNKTSSSVVVSVLVDPRETNDTEVDGLTLSRIFVVLLIDSIKYVTYSCIVPLKGAASQAVTK